MNLIIILHKILNAAYNRAIVKSERKAEKLYAESVAVGEEAAELASKAQAALDESRELAVEARVYSDHAVHIERQRQKAADLFGGI